LIANVFPDGPADHGGLQPGDIVVEYEGEPILDSHDLPARVARTPVGKEVRLRALRNGKELSVKVKLGEMDQGEKAAARSTQGKSGELGLTVREMLPEEMHEAGTKQGILVVGVEPGSPAEFAGIRGGDILLSINDTQVNRVGDFQQGAEKIKKGRIVRLRIKREDQTIFLAFTK